MSLKVLGRVGVSTSNPSHTFHVLSDTYGPVVVGHHQATDTINIFPELLFDHISWFTKPFLCKGTKYVRDMMKFMGINNYEELLVDGTGNTEQERQRAIRIASDKIPQLIDKLFS